MESLLPEEVQGSATLVEEKSDHKRKLYLVLYR